MKALKVLLTIIILCGCLDATAQFLIGGSIGISSSNEKRENDSPDEIKINDYSFTFSPASGISINEKLIVGFILDLTFEGSYNGAYTGAKHRSSMISGGPFIRYYPLRWNKLALFGHGNIGAGLSKTKTTYDNIPHDDSRETYGYILLFPGMSFDISEKLSLETSVNVLNVRYKYSVIKDDTETRKKSVLSFGTGLDNIVTSGSITIGAMYKF
jgi:opacity protein-like surface antigen